MKRFEEKPAESLVSLKCDCCGRESRIGDDYEASEFVSLDFVGGYKSIFGDGTQVSIDICQYCLKDKLGTWLKTSNNEGEIIRS
jgi:hypothetical protein